MGGLLDKASEKSAEMVEADKVEPVPAESKGEGLLSQSAEASKSVADSDSAVTIIDEEGSPMLPVLGVILLLISMVGFYNLRIVPGIAVVAVFLGSYAAFTYGMKTWLGTFSTDKFVAAGIVWMLLGAAPYLAAFDFTAIGNLSISEIEVDEDDDQLEFYIYTSIGDDIEVGIEYDGVEVWNSSVTASSGKKRVEVAFSDFYRQSAMDGAGNEVHIYTITASAGSTSGESKITGELLTRNVTDAGGELYTVSEYNDDTGTKDHLGAVLNANVGVKHPNMQRETGGDTNKYSTLINPVMSDYTFVIEVMFGGTAVWTSSQVSVDGDTATWAGGSGDISSGWVTLDGTAQGNVGGADVSYLDRDDFYQGDGCYTMQVTVTSELDGAILVDDNAAYEFFWEYNEDADRTGPYKNAVEC